MPRYQHILLIHDLGNDGGPDPYFSNCVLAMRYAGMSFDTLHVNSRTWPELGNYSAILVSLTEDAELPRGKAERLDLFVSSGGGLILVRPYWHGNLALLTGLPDDTEPLSLPTDEDIVFLRDFIPGIAGLQLRHQDDRYEVSPRNVSVIAKTESGTAVAWSRRHHSGNVIVFNTTLLEEKRSLGLITQALMRVHVYAVRPIANAGLIHVDDFPAAVSPKAAEPVWEEFSLPMIEFYDRIWLPDMLSLARRFNIPYTFLIPFNYNLNKTPPFVFNEWEAVTLPDDHVPFGVRAAGKIGTGHELGLHGYNHETFTLDNWKSEDYMREAIRTTMSRWRQDNLGPLPRTYVPPHNMYDQACVRVISEECPSVKSICADYHNEIQTGESREFGPEPWNGALTCLPRITSGYNMDAEKRFDTLSVLASMGLWTHMLHPDDIVDTPVANPNSSYIYRNAHCTGWYTAGAAREGRGLYAGIEEWLELVKTHYPWLRYFTTEEARASVLDYLSNRPLVSFDTDGINIKGSHSGWYELTADADARSMPRPGPGVEVVDSSTTDGCRRFVLRTSHPTASLSLSRS